MPAHEAMTIYVGHLFLALEEIPKKQGKTSFKVRSFSLHLTFF
jgi:hypothetical protein